MSQHGKRTTEQRLLTVLACGATVEAAARQATVSERTVYRRLADPAFQQQLNELRVEMVKRASGMLTGAALTAVKTLVELQAATMPAAVRLCAARSVLEIGMKLREVADIEVRLAELQERVATYIPLDSD